MPATRSPISAPLSADEFAAFLAEPLTSEVGIEVDRERMLAGFVACDLIAHASALFRGLFPWDRAMWPEFYADRPERRDPDDALVALARDLRPMLGTWLRRGQLPDPEQVLRSSGTSSPHVDVMVDGALRKREERKR